MDPAVLLGRAVRQRAHHHVLRAQPQKALELAPYRWQPPWLERQHIRPFVILAGLQHAPARELTVATHHEAGLRKVLLELRRQPAEGLQLAVLLDLLDALSPGRGRVGVVDELAADG